MVAEFHARAQARSDFSEVARKALKRDTFDLRDLAAGAGPIAQSTIGPRSRVNPFSQSPGKPMDLDSILLCLKRCPDYPDYPTAWAIQHSHGKTLPHHPRCSSVPGWDPISGPGFLCDCGAVVEEWKRIKALPDYGAPHIRDNL